MYRSYGRSQKLILLAAVVVLVLVMLAVGFGGPVQLISSDAGVRTVGAIGPPTIATHPQTHRAPAATPRGPPAS